MTWFNKNTISAHYLLSSAVQTTRLVLIFAQRHENVGNPLFSNIIIRRGISINTRVIWKVSLFFSLHFYLRCCINNKKARRNASSANHGNGFHYRSYNRVSLLGAAVDENKCYMATRAKLNFAHAYANSQIANWFSSGSTRRKMSNRIQ